MAKLGEHHLSVVFHAEDGSGRRVHRYFKSWLSFTHFTRHYEFFGGFRRFSVDVLNDFAEGTPVPATLETFKSIYGELYPNTPI